MPWSSWDYGHPTATVNGIPHCIHLGQFFFIGAFRFLLSASLVWSGIEALQGFWLPRHTGRANIDGPPKTQQGRFMKATLSDLPGILWGLFKSLETMISEYGKVWVLVKVSGSGICNFGSSFVWNYSVLRRPIPIPCKRTYWNRVYMLNLVTLDLEEYINRQITLCVVKMLDFQRSQLWVFTRKNSAWNL